MDALCFKTLVLLGYRVLFESRVLSSATGGGQSIAFFPLALPGISSKIAELGRVADKTVA